MVIYINHVNNLHRSSPLPSPHHKERRKQLEFQNRLGSSKYYPKPPILLVIQILYLEMLGWASALGAWILLLQGK
jgi:hypothetical protein